MENGGGGPERDTTVSKIEGTTCFHFSRVLRPCHVLETGAGVGGKNLEEYNLGGSCRPKSGCGEKAAVVQQGILEYLMFFLWKMSLDCRLTATKKHKVPGSE